MHVRTLTRDAVRRLDRRATEEFGIPGLVLMENAGRGAAVVLCRLGIAGPVAICCGKGNNGGDGFVIARHLEARGVEVRVLLFAAGEELAGDAAANFDILRRSGTRLEFHLAPLARERLRAALADADWIVDALLGTGATGEPRPPLDQAIRQINASGVKVLAIDLPSGLDCDTGQAAQNTIRAAHTVTFVAPKRGFLAPGADQFTGQVHVVEIGVPRKLLEETPWE